MKKFALVGWKFDKTVIKIAIIKFKSNLNAKTPDVAKKIDV